MMSKGDETQNESETDRERERERERERSTYQLRVMAVGSSIEQCKALVYQEHIDALVVLRIFEYEEELLAFAILHRSSECLVPNEIAEVLGGIGSVVVIGGRYL